MGSDLKKDFNAPKFRAYLQHLEGKQLLIWERDSWEKVKPCTGSPILLNIEELPMSDVVNDAIVIATTAQEITSSKLGIAIYRYDVGDPKPFNVDKYAVWEDLPSHYVFEDIVSESSTNINENLIDTLNKFVFITKKDKGPGHWLDFDELPYEVQVIIEVEDN